MKRIVLSLILLVITSAVFAADWDRYAPGVISDHLSKYNVKESETKIVDETAIKARVLHKNSSRPISEDKKEFINRWFKKIGLSQKHGDKFEREIKVFEGSKSYWIPVQRELQHDLWDDFKKFPAYIDIYIIHIGFVKGEPVILLNRYDSFE